MQNNVIELTQKLLRSLDSNYNVIDMPAVVEIISQLEKVAITKELLETTRLGKYINELRKKTTNEALSKRAKELVKKWRNAVLPESNGQIKQTTSPPLGTQEDVNLNQYKASKKRPAKEPPDLNAVALKRPKLNGGIPELDFSDNSNSSFKDVIAMKQQHQQMEPKLQQQAKEREVIVINSDSNSSLPEKGDPPLDQQMPKKRGRKKGSKNHKNLIDEAETSFTNKLAVSRGNSKVKTTQELIASLQNKSSNPVVNSISTKPKEDLMEKAAKLTERVSMIDQQLNTSGTRSKNSRKLKAERNERVIESGSVINDKSLLLKKEEEDEEDDDEEDDDINVVDEEPENVKKEINEETESKETENVNIITSLCVEEALALLPPIDKSVLLEDEDEVHCTCILKETKSDFSVEENTEPVMLERRYEFLEDGNCPAREHLHQKYHLDHVTEEQARRLHAVNIPNLNGNWSLSTPKEEPQMLDNGLYANVVPNVTREYLPRETKCFASENFKKYSFSEKGDTGGGEDSGVVVKKEDVEEERTTGDDSDTRCFREWHDVIATHSYNGEILKILPYCIID